MRYLNGSELYSFHESFLKALKKHSSSQSEEEWGYPSGVDICDTFSFTTEHGTLLIGYLDRIKELGRWWVPITLQDNISTPYAQITIDFEMSIPMRQNFHVSVHYTITDDGAILILHKGKFTIGHGSRSMSEFFEYYRKNPGRWQIIQFNGYNYLQLGRINPESFDNEFLKLISSLADFAKYIRTFKKRYRS